MSDLLEHDLRGALAERAAHITPQATARLQRIDYRPRAGWRPRRRVAGAAGLSGLAATAGAVILLGSSAAPAFAGWTRSPTAALSGQLAAAQRDCGMGSPVLSDTRGPYTASIYADGSTCVEGNGLTIRSARGGGRIPSPAAGTVQLNGFGEADSEGHALTMVFGQIGAGVTGVTVTRGDGGSVQATVANGWYLAWWPGAERAVTARVTTATGSSTQSFPAGPGRRVPACPTGTRCASAYGFGTAPAHGGSGTTSVRTGGGSAGQ